MSLMLCAPDSFNQPIYIYKKKKKKKKKNINSSIHQQHMFMSAPSKIFIIKNKLPHEKTNKPTYAKPKAQIGFAVTELSSTFVVATQFLYFLNPKFLPSSHLLCLYCTVCVCLAWSKTTLLVFTHSYIQYFLLIRAYILYLHGLVNIYSACQPHTHIFEAFFSFQIETIDECLVLP